MWKGKFYNALINDIRKEKPIKGSRKPLNLERTLQIIREEDAKLCNQK